MQIELCVAVSQRRTPYGRKRTGLCSGYLARLAVNDSVRVSIKPGTIRGTSFCQPAADMLILAPASAPAPTQAIPAGAVPVIMVGPGTGVAPMRALIQHEICRQKVFAKSAVPSSSESGACTSAEAPLQAWLFFGCRKSQRDYLYGFDWTAINNNTNPYTDPYRSIARSGADYGGVGVIPQQQDGGGKGDESISSIRAGSIRVCTAFSQDQLVKQYVGHKIITNGALICSLLLKVRTCTFVLCLK